MRIIGIDPGTVCCGYGIVDVSGSKLAINSKQRKRDREPVYIASGDVRMNRKKALPDRLKLLYESLNTILDEHKPYHLCLEKIFYHKSIRSAFTLGSTRGIVMLLAAEHGIPVYEYNPTELKMALTGYGRAEKRQVKEMVIRILNINPSHKSLSDDSSDALALCICHANSFGYSSQLKRSQ
jgi:crossover junction endodeoxyribonuclease RuvC